MFQFIRAICFFVKYPSKFGISGTLDGASFRSRNVVIGRSVFQAQVIRSLYLEKRISANPEFIMNDAFILMRLLMMT